MVADQKQQQQDSGSSSSSEDESSGSSSVARISDAEDELQAESRYSSATMPGDSKTASSKYQFRLPKKVSQVSFQATALRWCCRTVANGSRHNRIFMRCNVPNVQDPNDWLWMHDEEPHRSRRRAILKAHPEVRVRCWCSPLLVYKIYPCLRFTVLGHQVDGIRAPDQICRLPGRRRAVRDGILPARYPPIELEIPPSRLCYRRDCQSESLPCSECSHCTRGM